MKLLITLFGMLLTNILFAQGWIGNSGTNLIAYNSNKQLTPLNVGIGIKKPSAVLHVSDGIGGTMKHPYEAVVAEKLGDTKLGIYSTSIDPVNTAAGAALTLGYTNYTGANGNYPGYEMQYAIWPNVGSFLRFNSIQRNANGEVIYGTGTYQNIVVLDNSGRMGINLTHGSDVEPLQPSANLHIYGTVRFQNLPSGNGDCLVIDANGNV